MKLTTGNGRRVNINGIDCCVFDWRLEGEVVYDWWDLRKNGDLGHKKIKKQIITILQHEGTEELK